MSNLKERLAALTPAQQKVLLRRLQRKRQEDDSLPPISVRKRETTLLPLSFSQERLWFLYQLEPLGTAYHMSAALRLHGPLNIRALERSLSTIVQRHEILRTTFHEHAEGPRQVVAPSLELLIPVIDIRGQSEQDQRNLVDRLARQESERLFDLAKGPLLRVHLLRLETQEHVLLLTMHHIVADEWSVNILTHELSVLYQSELTGLTASLPEILTQYADYALWQRQWLQGEVLQKQLNYWQKQLVGAPAISQIPTDRPRPALLNSTGATRSLLIPLVHLQKLKGLSQREGATLFMTLFAAFNILLMRFSGQQDIVVGTPIANRTHEELEHSIGFFANMLALRTDLRGNPDFHHLLQRVREITLAAYTHQDLPFEKLVDALQIERSSSYSPLFQVVFVLQTMLQEKLELQDLSWEPLALDHTSVKPDLTFMNTSSKFDLTLRAEETAQGLWTSVEYRTDLFEERTVQSLLEHWQILLSAIVQETGQGIADLPLLSSAEQQRLLHGGKATYEINADNLCLHILFEQQVSQRPDAIAVVYKESSLTYQELNERANQFAHWLQTQGVGTDVRVGLCLERSLWLPICILAILKAGGAYVPLDPSYPEERLAFLLEDCQPALVLTVEHCAPRLSSQEIPILLVDKEWNNYVHSQLASNPEKGSTAQQLAYLIYTSGSTGTPKGVMIPHANVVRLFRMTESWFSFNENDVWTLFHAYAFDFSVWEFWGALLSGGRLVIVPYWVSRTPDDFYRLLLAEQVTMLNQTPSAFRQLMQVDAALAIAQGLALRSIIFGGEALDLTSLRPWAARHGDQHPQLINMYGITETTVHVTYRLLLASDLEVNPGSLIGEPIPDLYCYVLDTQQRLVPIGIPGELYVGGPGVARGYWQRADLTAERFVPDPFSHEPGARLYRTGDLVRVRQRRELEYLGRIDQQIKLRGFRIELGEIEAALRTQASVRDAVVLLRQESAAQPYLVAYVVKGDETLRAQQLLHQLRAQLPDYMVPTSLVFLDALPLTAHGKIDQRALPVPTGMQSDQERHYEAPQTSQEALLAQIWADVLHVARVGRHDNYFAAGGDSIRSIQIRTRAREAGIFFNIQDLFRFPTIAQLLAQANQNDAVSSELEDLHTEPLSLLSEEDRRLLPPDIEDAYPLSALQAGMFFHSEYEPEMALYHDLLTAQIEIPQFDLSAFQRAVASIIQRHAVLRTSFDFKLYQEPMQFVHRRVELPLKVADLRALSASEQEQILIQWRETERRRVFAYSHAPLFLLQLHLLSDSRLAFAFSFHHAILDGWSMHTLLTELLEIYMTLQQGKEPVVEPPASSFRDFVMMERQIVSSELAQLYWQQQLQGAPVHQLPEIVTFSPDKEQLEDGHTITLSEALTTGLNALAQTLQVSLKSVLLAAHLRVLSVLYGQQEMISGVVGNGRPENRDGERVLGLFLNTLPLRLKLPEGDWQTLIRETAHAEMEMTTYRRYPLARLQQEHGAANLFDVAFNFMHFHVWQGVVHIPGFVVDNIWSTAPTNFKLMLNVTQNPDTGQISFHFDYDRTLLTAAQIETISGYYQRALESMVRAPGQRYLANNLLSEEDNHYLVTESSRTLQTSVYKQHLHHIFEEQATSTPDAIALVFEEHSLTYAELNARANQLAHYLCTLGIGPDDRVGLCMDRSLEVLIGLLGILKAGGVYVPLDPSYPEERLVYMLQNAQISLIVTQEMILARFPQLASQDALTPLCLDQLRPTLEEQPSINPSVICFEDQLVYVIYTSGSTGRPKGVAQRHCAIANLLAWQRDTLPLTPGTIVLQFAPLGFDVACQELFSTWQSGGTLLMISEEVRRDPEALLQMLAQRSIERVFVPYVVLQQLAQTAIQQPALVLCLQDIITAGEQLHMTQPITAWLRQLQDCRLHNHYGPTETHVVTSYTLGEQAEQWPALPPIGQPIANTQVYILDAQHQLVPLGVPGELCIGGENLARGYLYHPDLTAERFIANPFSQQAGSRLYRTGDLARYNENSDIEYLGRRDQQVKLRGFRIELGEIEETLRLHPAVLDAIAVLWEGQLVAYIVSQTNQTLSAGQLRQHLGKYVPHYMLPASFMFLETLPVTANGKVNRQVLPVPTLTTTSQQTYMTPLTPVQELLMQIWLDVLHLTQVSIHDNFFELGGHSLLATQVMARVRQVLQVEVPLRYLFTAPTIALLGQHIELLMQASERRAIAPIVCRDQSEKARLSFTQERFWFLDQLDPDSTSYLQPVAFRLQGSLSVRALAQSLQALVQRHEILRTRFVLQDDLPVQVIVPSIDAPLQIIDLRGVADTQREHLVDQVVVQMAWRPFDLKTGPLLRVYLLPLAEQEHVLLFSIHHIIFDGWSIGTLIREFRTLYHASIADEPVDLPALPVQYADYAHWQREWLQGKVLQEQLDYWRTQLAGVPTSVNLPIDRPRVGIYNHQSLSQTILVSNTETENLKRLSQQQSATLFMTLLAALQTVLFRWSGQADMVIGTVIANRTRTEIEPLIGCFLNFLALRSRMQPALAWEQLLKDAKMIVLGAYAHQDLPFEKIVEELKPDRTHYHNPFYNVAFLLQNVPQESLSTDGLSFQYLPLPPRDALLDLRFVVSEAADGLLIMCEYDADLFRDETIHSLLEAYQLTLSHLVIDPATPLAAFPWPEALVRQTEASPRPEQKQKIAIAATFTSEPIEESLTYWMREMQISAEIAFSSYNQVLQQLLDPQSLLSTNTHGVNLILLRSEDWQRFEREPEQTQITQQRVEQLIHEFLQALRQLSLRTSVPCLLCICPMSPQVQANAELSEIYRRVEEYLAQEIATIEGIFLIPQQELSTSYPVDDCYDPYTDKVGHVPFTQRFFTALGTLVARKIAALKFAPYKVIVVDCDQTLWQGVCGEDGPLGIVVDPAGRALQEFLIAQQEAGRLICLCSKNNEQDVFAVFDTHPDMLLKREHLAQVGINWRPKSENLRSLAQSLNLSLESMILIDDSPLEWAEVRSHYPEVLIFPFPPQIEELPRLLRHFWAFDRLARTAEDQQRTTFYQQEQQRRAFLQATASLENFLAVLNLQVHIAPMEEEHLARAAQLTQRTNQFNATTIRRSENEILHFCREERNEAFVIHVNDRFGEYGLVGLVLCTTTNDTLLVDTFLLSCRVLGRGVEHRIVAYLGALARERGLDTVSMPYIPTARNQPVCEFLERTGKAFKISHEQCQLFAFPASVATQLRYSPGADQESAEQQFEEAEEKTVARATGVRQYLDQAQLVKIATELNTVEKIHQKLHVQNQRKIASDRPKVQPQTIVEKELLAIWTELLNLDGIGITDNFFAIGGHSLLATQVLSQIRTIFRVELPLHSIFDKPTIAEMAPVIEQMQREFLRQHEDEHLAQMLIGMGGLSDEDLRAIFTDDLPTESGEHYE